MCCLLGACHTRPPRQVKIRAGRLIDGTGGPVRRSIVVSIEDGLIVGLAPDTLGANPPGAIIDARRLTVLPGLIDANAAIFAPTDAPLWRLSSALRRARQLYWRGVTAAVSLAAPHHAVLTLRRYLGTGRHRGPRLFACGVGLNTDEPRPQRAAQKTRQHIRDVALAGFDCISLFIHEPVSPSVETPTVAGEALPGALCTAISEAQRQDLPAWVHTSENNLAYTAARCGANVLVGADLKLSLGRLIPNAPRAGLKTSLVLIPKPFADVREGAASRYTLREWAASGVSMAWGSHVPTAGELPIDPVAALQAFVDAGLSPQQVIEAATRGSARALNLHDALGTIAVGFRADLIAVQGEPDADLSVLRELRHVIIDGVEQHVAAHWYDAVLLVLERVRTWLEIAQ